MTTPTRPSRTATTPPAPPVQPGEAPIVESAAVAPDSSGQAATGLLVRTAPAAPTSPRQAETTAPARVAVPTAASPGRAATPTSPGPAAVGAVPGQVASAGFARRDQVGGDASLLGMTAMAVVGTVTDPELPMLTLADLGIVRDVREDAEGVVVTITPTYSGCPAMDTMREDLTSALRAAGHPRVEVRTVLTPAWTTDWITAAGREKLAAAGIAPPGSAPARVAGPVPLVLGPSRRGVRCPHCGHAETEQISAFGATACRELRRCPQCREPFEHMKEI